MTDHAWDALVDVTGSDPKTMRGALNAALASIKGSTAELDIGNGELAMMIRARAVLYREVMPDAMLTAPALAKWWSTLEEQKARVAERQRKGTNLNSNSGCTTCGGDHWVIVRYRPAAKPTNPNERGHEETAPCPVCNLEPKVMRNFWDGRSWTYGKGPGELEI